jgi:hypothetical protein
MQVFHKWRHKNGRRDGPCGGRLVEIDPVDQGEEQHRCLKCGQVGRPVLNGEPDVDVDNSPIYLEGMDICVTDMLAPPSKFAPPLGHSWKNEDLRKWTTNRIQ